MGKFGRGLCWLVILGGPVARFVDSYIVLADLARILDSFDPWRLPDDWLHFAIGSVGSLVAVAALINLLRRRARSVPPPSPRAADATLVAFSLATAVFTGLSFAVSFGLNLYAIFVASHFAALVALAWTWSRVRERAECERIWALGLGTGFWREAAWGVVVALTLRAGFILLDGQANIELPELRPWVFIFVVSAPLAEESLFRGALFGSLRRSHGWLATAAVVGALFTLWHGPVGIERMVTLFLHGFVFGLLREWRGSLVAPWIAHGLWNAQVLL